MVNGSSIPVVAGLAIGIAFIVLFSVMLKPDFMLTDEELISKYSKLTEVEYFLERYPEATATVNRSPNENYVEVSYTIERQVASPSELYTGINIFGMHVSSRSNHVSFGLTCGVYHGVTIGGGLVDLDSIEQAEENCFRNPNNDGMFEPDNSGDELNEEVFQLAFRP